MADRLESRDEDISELVTDQISFTSSQNGAVKNILGDKDSSNISNKEIDTAGQSKTDSAFESTNKGTQRIISNSASVTKSFVEDLTTLSSILKTKDSPGDEISLKTTDNELPATGSQDRTSKESNSNVQEASDNSGSEELKTEGPPYKNNCKYRSRNTWRCQKQLRELINKQELKKEQLEKKEGDLRDRSELLECMLPAIMIQKILRKVREEPSSLPHVVQEQLQASAVPCSLEMPSSPSQHYDCRVRKMEAERKQALHRAEEARALWAKKEFALKDLQRKVEESAKLRHEREERIERLAVEMAEARTAFDKGKGEGFCETGECGDVKCRSTRLGNSASETSIKSTDLECIIRLQELAQETLCMKRHIADLERREEMYMRTLQQAGQLLSKVPSKEAIVSSRGLKGVLDRDEAEDELDTKSTSSRRIEKVASTGSFVDEDAFSDLSVEYPVCPAEYTCGDDDEEEVPCPPNIQRDVDQRSDKVILRLTNPLTSVPAKDALRKQRSRDKKDDSIEVPYVERVLTPKSRKIIPQAKNKQSVEAITKVDENRQLIRTTDQSAQTIVLQTEEKKMEVANGENDVNTLPSPMQINEDYIEIPRRDLMSWLNVMQEIYNLVLDCSHCFVEIHSAANMGRQLSSYLGHKWNSTIKEVIKDTEKVETGRVINQREVIINRTAIGKSATGKETNERLNKKKNNISGTTIPLATSNAFSVVEKASNEIVNDVTEKVANESLTEGLPSSMKDKGRKRSRRNKETVEGGRAIKNNFDEEADTEGVVSVIKDIDIKKNGVHELHGDLLVDNKRTEAIEISAVPTTLPVDLRRDVIEVTSVANRLKAASRETLTKKSLEEVVIRRKSPTRISSVEPTEINDAPVRFESTPRSTSYRLYNEENVLPNQQTFASPRYPDEDTSRRVSAESNSSRNHGLSQLNEIPDKTKRRSVLLKDENEKVRKMSTLDDTRSKPTLRELNEISAEVEKRFVDLINGEEQVTSEHGSIPQKQALSESEQTLTNAERGLAQLTAEEQYKRRLTSISQTSQKADVLADKVAELRSVKVHNLKEIDDAVESTSLPIADYVVKTPYPSMTSITDHIKHSTELIRSMIRRSETDKLMEKYSKERSLFGDSEQEYIFPKKPSVSKSSSVSKRVETKETPTKESCMCKSEATERTKVCRVTHVILPDDVPLSEFKKFLENSDNDDLKSRIIKICRRRRNKSNCVSVETGSDIGWSSNRESESKVKQSPMKSRANSMAYHALPTSPQIPISKEFLKQRQDVACLDFQCALCGQMIITRSDLNSHNIEASKSAQAPPSTDRKSNVLCCNCKPKMSKSKEQVAHVNTMEKSQRKDKPNPKICCPCQETGMLATAISPLEVNIENTSTNYPVNSDIDSKAEDDHKI